MRTTPPVADTATMGSSRKLIGLVGALVCALLGTFLVLGSRGDKKADTAAPVRQPVAVLVATKALVAGTSAEKLAGTPDLLVVKQLPPEQVPADAFKDAVALASYKGKVLASEVAIGAPLVPSLFVDRAALSLNPTGIEVPADRLQVSFSVEPQRAMGGKLRPGDLVAVTYTDPEGRSRVIVQKALIADVQLANLATVTDAPQASAGDAAASAATGNYMITLALTLPDVERVTNALETGKLWLARQPSTAVGTGTRVVTPELNLTDPATSYEEATK